MSTANRSMFWRVIRRSLFANRGRLLVILLALGAGAAVTAALLNLQIDAKRRINSEFRAFGANVVIVPGPDPQRNWPATLPESLVQTAAAAAGENAEVSGLLYTIGIVEVRKLHGELPVDPKMISQAVIAGYSSRDFSRLYPHRVVEVSQPLGYDDRLCYVGEKAARQLKINARDSLNILRQNMETGDDCFVQEIDSFGGTEDGQIFIPLRAAQRIAGLPGAVSSVALRLPGDSREVQQAVQRLQSQIPGADVRPLRQFAEGEAQLYEKISGALTATIVVVLFLTALCVMAAMTNVAMERKNDVGLMKALGGSVRRVLRLFLAEAALLGLAAGLLGAALGILLSIALGKAVFGVPAAPRAIVYPVSVALTVIVAVLAAYPLRRLAQIRPASVFRGEE